MVAMVSDTASGQSNRHEVGTAVVGRDVGAGVGGTETDGRSVGAGVGIELGAVVVKRVKLTTFVWWTHSVRFPSALPTKQSAARCWSSFKHDGAVRLTSVAAFEAAVTDASTRSESALLDTRVHSVSSDASSLRK